MVRSDREGVDDGSDEIDTAELWIGKEDYNPDRLHDPLAYNDRFAAGEVVRVKGPTKTLVGVIIKRIGLTGLYVMFPQFDVPQLMRSIHVEKLNED